MPLKRMGKSSTATWAVQDLGKFYTLNRSSLVKYADRLLRDSHRAEEVVQDALVRVILAAPELRDESHANAYMYRTIENLCLDIFRLERRRPHLVAVHELTEAVEVEASLRVQKDLADEIATADDAAIVRQALSLLSPAERAALVMWEMEGRSTREIARELGIKESAVRHTVSRARASLKKVLTNLVIDEARGLTALDLLSSSFRKSADIAKKTSRIALSVVLLFAAYLGFSNFTYSPSGISADQISKARGNLIPNVGIQNPLGNQVTNRVLVAKSNSVGSEPKVLMRTANAKPLPLSFVGLNEAGVPTSFTVTDLSGSNGSLYFSPRDVVISEVGLSLSSIVKTSAGTGAPNVLLNQTISQSEGPLGYEALIAFGRKGAWIPTISKVISVESERLITGNYLLTAVIQVKSEVESSIAIPATAGGRDLETMPSRVVTRVLLNTSKTQVLAQAVQVIEKVSR